jgi:L-amino acid N-acyltransferase
MPIRPATHADLPAINEIYNHYVLHSTCTYQTVPSTAEERLQWFEGRGVAHPVRVMEGDGGEVLAWHSLSPFKTREAYARTVENSIYVAASHLGEGLGRVMLEDQLRVAGELNHHAILAVICAGQAPSIHLHQKFGFDECGRMREVGFKFGRWLDIVIMQKLIGV